MDMTLGFFISLIWPVSSQALKRDHKALTLAQELGHPFTLAAALGTSAMFYQYRREEQLMQEQIEANQKISGEHGFALYMMMGTFLQAWALTEHRQVDKGITQIQQCLTTVRALGVELLLPYWLLLLAEAHGKGGQPEEGLRVLAEALAMVDKNGERRWEAELYRLKGTLTLQQFQVSSSRFQVQENQKSKGKGQRAKITNSQSPTPNPQAEAEAEACFLKAIEVARRQSAKSWELRATVSLTRVWQSQGKRKEAHKLLSEIYDWFTEGFDTKDLQEAKALLGELQR